MLLRRLGAGAATFLLLTGTLAGPVEAAGHARQRAAAHPVVETRVIGHSVRGRPITAYRLGEPGGPAYVLIATMHGNEPAPKQILDTLRTGETVRGIDLWVVPTYNPDGLAAHTRRNAHGVDLNRNYPNDWAPLTGNYYAGPRPASEPETRAMMRFLRQVRPRRVVSFHQPLNGVDVATKDPGFARRIARALRLPTTDLDCGSTCHGTMTGWFNRHFGGSALTVEYGDHPGRRRLRGQAPGALVRLLGGRLVETLTLR